MAKPMRRSSVVLGPEPCTRSTWCSDISPASSATSTPWPSGTSTAISWPRLRRLSACVAMLELVPQMAAGPEFHGAAGHRRIGERHPGGDDVAGAEPPVGRILVPGYVCRRARLLGEERGAPAQDVGADDVLDGIEDPGMARQLVGPGEEKMHLLAHVAAERPAQRALLRLQTVAIGARLGGR